MSYEDWYHVSPRIDAAPNWWASARAAEWPATLVAARPLLDGRAVRLPVATADEFRRWALSLPGWPRSVTDGDAPIALENIGLLDAAGEPRTRWAIRIFASEAERNALELAAAVAGKTVGSYLRDAGLILAGGGEE